MTWCDVMSVTHGIQNWNFRYEYFCEIGAKYKNYCSISIRGPDGLEKSRQTISLV